MNSVELAIVLGVGVVTLSCLYQFLKRQTGFHQTEKHRGCQECPKYPHLDIFGHDLYTARQTAYQAGTLNRHYELCYTRLGHTWREKVYGQTTINTCNQENIQYVVALAHQSFGKGTRTAASKLLGTGIFGSDGAEWKASRDMIKPTFSKTEIGADLGQFKVHLDQFMAMLPQDGSTVDLQPLLKRLFLDSATEFMFGEPIGALQSDDSSKANHFLKDLEQALAGVGKRRSAGVLQFIYYFDKQWPAAIGRVHAFLDAHVHRALSTTSPDSSQDTQDRYVLLYEMAKRIRDPIRLRHELMNVLMPARDTTAVMVSDMLFQLARNPHIWAELRAVSLALHDPDALTFETLKSLVPFRHVIFETLRTVGFNGRVARTALHDTILPRGGGPDGTSPMLVRKGTVVDMSIRGLHRDPAIWGEDSHEFRPGRWRERRAPLWEFVPFLGSPRICPAQQQVIVQATYVLVRLTRCFERIENRDPVLDYVELHRMLAESRNGVKVALIPGREGEFQVA